MNLMWFAILQVLGTESNLFLGNEPVMDEKTHVSQYGMTVADHGCIPGASNLGRGIAPLMSVTSPAARSWFGWINVSITNDAEP